MDHLQYWAGLETTTNQVISSNLTWKVSRLLPKIRNLSQYVPAALAALLVPDGYVVA